MNTSIDADRSVMVGALAYALSDDGLQRADARPAWKPNTPEAPDLLREPRFRFWASKEGGVKIELTNVAGTPGRQSVVEDATWEDAGPVMSGTITLRDPSYGLGPDINVGLGDRVFCDVDEGAGFKELWTLRCAKPDENLKEGQTSFQLASDLDLLVRSTDDFKFVKNKAHPKGWRGDEIIRFICERYGVKVRGLPVFESRWTRKFYRGVSPVDVFQQVFNRERLKTGRRYVLRWEGDGLVVSPLKRSAYLLELGPTLLDAALSEHMAEGEPVEGVADAYFASAVTFRGTTDLTESKDLLGHRKPKKAKILSYQESPASRKRFGFVHRVVWSADVDTVAEAAKEAKDFLAAVGKPIKELKLTHSGIPRIQRGDAIQLGLDDEGLRQQTVWVKEVAFALNPGAFLMTLVMTFDDPYVDERAKRIADALKNKKKKPAQGKTGAQRSDSDALRGQAG